MMSSWLRDGVQFGRVWAVRDGSPVLHRRHQMQPHGIQVRMRSGVMLGPRQSSGRVRPCVFLCSRLFGNRSLCYERMQQYENACRDADIALSMEPKWIKGLFRKGKALCGLKVKHMSEYELIFRKAGVQTWLFHTCTLS